jgi:hypothetical protein
LERLSGITAAIGVATIAAVGVLGVYVGKALPGHHAGTTATTATAGNSGQSASTSGAQNSLNPPATPTQGVSGPAPVTSGSS